MVHTQQVDGIKLDIQAVDITIGEDVQEAVIKMITNLQRFVSEINWVDVHFKKEGGQSTDHRLVTVRLGIPGNDCFASVSGDHWIPLLKLAEEKLKVQLNKRKK
jgi:ribosomal subunit interface protein